MLKHVYTLMDEHKTQANIYINDLQGRTSD